MLKASGSGFKPTIWHQSNHTQNVGLDIPISGHLTHCISRCYLTFMIYCDPVVLGEVGETTLILELPRGCFYEQDLYSRIERIGAQVPVTRVNTLWPPGRYTL